MKKLISYQQLLTELPTDDRSYAIRSDMLGGDSSSMELVNMELDDEILDYDTLLLIDQNTRCLYKKSGQLIGIPARSYLYLEPDTAFTYVKDGDKFLQIETDDLPQIPLYADRFIKQTDKISNSHIKSYLKVIQGDTLEAITCLLAHIKILMTAKTNEELIHSTYYISKLNRLYQQYIISMHYMQTFDGVGQTVESFTNALITIASFFNFPFPDIFIQSFMKTLRAEGDDKNVFHTPSKTADISYGGTEKNMDAYNQD